MDDIALRQNILDDLEFEPSIDAAHIGVAVTDGVVTLTGYVSTYAEKVAAEHVAQRVKGTRAIAEEIEVRHPEDKKTADDQIAERALKILSWDTTIPSDSISIKVEHGWVTLAGEVEWNFERTAAKDAVMKLTGVTGVVDLLKIRPRANQVDIKSRIEDALKRNAALEADGIQIEVSGGEVTLKGKVHAWHERGIAERAAWSTPGVTVVRDHLSFA
jgi:osmotically-inducible protein OsmY